MRLETCLSRVTWYDVDITLSLFTKLKFEYNVPGLMVASRMIPRNVLAAFCSSDIAVLQLQSKTYDSRHHITVKINQSEWTVPTFYMEDCQTTGWIKFKNQNLYHVYNWEAMNRKLKSILVTLFLIVLFIVWLYPTFSLKSSCKNIWRHFTWLNQLLVYI